MEGDQRQDQGGSGEAASRWNGVAECGQCDVSGIGGGSHPDPESQTLAAFEEVVDRRPHLAPTDLHVLAPPSEGRAAVWETGVGLGYVSQGGSQTIPRCHPPAEKVSLE